MENQTAKQVKSLVEELNAITDILSACKSSKKEVARTCDPRISKKFTAQNYRTSFKNHQYNAVAQPFSKYSSSLATCANIQNGYVHNRSQSSVSRNTFTKINSLKIQKLPSSTLKPVAVSVPQSHTVSSANMNTRYVKTNCATNTVAKSSAVKSLKTVPPPVFTSKNVQPLKNVESKTVQSVVCTDSVQSAKDLLSTDSPWAGSEGTSVCSGRNGSPAGLGTSSERNLSSVDGICFQLMSEIIQNIIDLEAYEVVRVIISEIIDKVNTSCVTLQVTDQHPCQETKSTVYEVCDQDNSTLTRRSNQNFQDLSESRSEIREHHSENANSTLHTKQECAAEAGISSGLSTRQAVDSASGSEELLSCHAEQVWKSKYKVVNKHQSAALVSNDSKVLRKVQIQCSQEKRGALHMLRKELSCEKQVCVPKSKYKLINNPEKSKSSITKLEISSSNKIAAKLALSGHPRSVSSNRLTCRGIKEPLDKSNGTSLRSTYYSTSGSPTKLNRNLHKGPLSILSAKSIQSTPKASPFVVNHAQDTPEFLKKKLNEMEFIRSSEYEGYDLTHITPEELVSLDHKSLLKLSALLLDPKPKRKSFIKKSKYKIVSKRKSSVKKKRGRLDQRHQSTCIPSRLVAKHNYSTSMFKKKNLYGQSSVKKELFKVKHTNRTPKRFVMIGDIPYKVSRTKITKSTEQQHPTKVKSQDIVNKNSTVVVIRGVRFEMDATGKSLKALSPKDSTTFKKTPLRRVDIGGKTYVGTSPGVLTESPSQQVRSLASRVLHRSIQRAVAASSKKPAVKTSSYCMFYNRFGKCNRGENCPYIHDPSKIAVCTRFLRGSCKVDGCPFSHEINPGKMAICSFFLQGACTNKNCPYRHETLKPDTELCKAFVKGYCSYGSQCKKAHILICPKYAQGSCEKGEQCIYPHPPRKAKRKAQNDDGPNKPKQPKKEEEEEKAEMEDEENESLRYFTFDPISGEVRYVGNESEDIKVSVRPNQLDTLPQYIPLEFDDAEYLE